MITDILKLAIPSILANITIPLVGIVDVAIIGHIADASVIGGIAIGTMLFDLLYWNFGFLRVGTSGMTAQAYGRRDDVACINLLTQSLTISAMAAVFIWLIQWAFVTLVLLCVPCSPEVADFARQYFFVRVWAAPATLALMAFKGWFIGMQNTVYPMITDIVVNVVNMVSSYVIAVHTSLGPIGVAYGTLIAQYMGLLTASLLWYVRYSTLFVTHHPDWPTWDSCRKLVVLNTQLFERSLCFMIVYVGFTSLTSHYGDTNLAVSSILMKLFMFFSFFADGFAYAGEALTGRYIGERNAALLRCSVRVNFAVCLVVGLFFTILYTICGDLFLSWITSDTTILLAARDFRIWLIMMPLLSALAFMWDGIFIGAADGVSVRNCMVWAAVSFVVLYMTTCHWLGIQAVYMAYFAHLIARSLYLTIRWHSSCLYANMT